MGVAVAAVFAAAFGPFVYYGQVMCIFFFQVSFFMLMPSGFAFGLIMDVDCESI